MRVIETQIVDAMTKAKEAFLSKRDRVLINVDGSVVYYLWKSPIVKLKDGVLLINNFGYKTKTTKQRINAILSGFGKKEGIYQKGFKWFWFQEDGTSVEFKPEIQVKI